MNKSSTFNLSVCYKTYYPEHTGDNPSNDSFVFMCNVFTVALVGHRSFSSLLSLNNETFTLDKGFCFSFLLIISFLTAMIQLLNSFLESLSSNYWFDNQVFFSVFSCSFSSISLLIFYSMLTEILVPTSVNILCNWAFFLELKSKSF